MTEHICPVCRLSTKKKLKNEVPLSLHFQIAFTVFFLSTLAYLWRGPALAWKFLFFYLPLWAIAEFLHHLQMRQAARCEFCGFDPLLYVRDWKAARKEVEERLGGKVQEITKTINEQKNLVSAKSPSSKDNSNAALNEKSPTN